MLVYSVQVYYIICLRDMARMLVRNVKCVLWVYIVNGSSMGVMRFCDLLESLIVDGIRYSNRVFGVFFVLNLGSFLRWVLVSIILIWKLLGMGGI